MRGPCARLTGLNRARGDKLQAHLSFGIETFSRWGAHKCMHRMWAGVNLFCLQGRLDPENIFLWIACCLGHFLSLWAFPRLNPHLQGLVDVMPPRVWLARQLLTVWIWTCHLKWHRLSWSVILSCYRRTCLLFCDERLCNKPGVLLVPDPVFATGFFFFNLESEQLQ